MPFGSLEGVQGVLSNRKTVPLDTIETLQAIGGAVMGLKQHQILILGKNKLASLEATLVRNYDLPAY